MRVVVLMACLIALTAFRPASGRTVLHVLGESDEKNLLADPGFEQAQSPWKAYGEGFVVDRHVQHSGKSSIRCDNPSVEQGHGAFQTITLNQKTPKPIRAVAWSRSEGVSAAAMHDYSLYLDVQYTDGSWLYAMVHNFDPEDRNWQRGEVVVHPEKPIKLVNAYVLLRWCVGKAWFDDCLLEEIGGSEGQSLFDGVVVSRGDRVQNYKSVPLQTEDGLKLHLTDSGTLADDPSMRVAFENGGFYVRDVAAGSGFVTLESTKPPVKRSAREYEINGEALGMNLRVRARAHGDHIRFDCEAAETTGEDRAVTIGFALPVGVGGHGTDSPRWWHSIRSSEPVRPDRSYCDGVPVETGALGLISKYPFACLGDQCLAIPMDEPCVYRIGYSGQLGWYYVAFDLGFCPDEGVKRQKFSFLIYKAEGGMRGAADKYYRIFPEHFRKRVEREGNWMAFLKVRSVQGWGDFGFAFHEGDNDIEWDARNGIYSFRYTEPMSYWMPMEKDLPRTREQAFRMIDESLKQTEDPARRNWASAVKTSLAYDDSGKPRMFFLDAPWCDGALFLMNPNPALPKGEMPATRASIAWSREIAEKLYGDRTKPQLAGEYLDSVEMGAEYVNTRREHFRYARCPLTFSRLTKKPAILQILSTYEFARAMADDVHARGKLMMANCIPNRFGFVAHLFDVMGVETNWLSAGKYDPVTDDLMDFRRTLCHQKPYCFLMNTDYETFDHSMVEKYMQRCMFWGMFPSFFSPDAATRLYFEQPKYYNRDRDLFRKYLPIIMRIAKAGWEPLTKASSSDPSIEIERFGPREDVGIFFTVRNTGSQPRQALITLEPELGTPRKAVRLPGSEPLTVDAGGRIAISMQPDEVAVVEVHGE